MEQKRIIKIALTGGPCGGKTTVLDRIRRDLSAEYDVIFISETATELISDGIAPWTMESPDAYQEVQLHLQLHKERIILKASEKLLSGKDVLVVCDRGLIDNKAYMSDGEYSASLNRMGLQETAVRNSYEAVFHLVTAAKGAVEYYTLSGNSARTEDPETAADIDDRLIDVWKEHPRRYVIDNSRGFLNKADWLMEELRGFLETYKK